MQVGAIANYARVRRHQADPQFHCAIDGKHVNFYGDRYCLEQLAAFYEPYYTLDRALAQNPDASIYAIVESKGQPDNCEEPNDMSTYLLPSSLEAIEPGVLYARRPNTGIELVVFKDSSEIFLFSCARQELMLQLRTFVRDQIFQPICKNAGSIFIHASAVERNGVGVVFVGHRNAGKTASFMGFAARGDFNIVSADRVGLRVVGNDVVASGFPSRCNIHKFAFETDPILQRVANEQRISNDPKTLVDMKLIAKAAMVNVSPAFRLGAVVLPNIGGNSNSVQTERLSGSLAASMALSRNLLNGDESDHYVHWLRHFEVGSGVVNGALERIAETIGSRIPMIRIHSAYESYVMAIQSKALGLPLP